MTSMGPTVKRDDARGRTRHATCRKRGCRHEKPVDRGAQRLDTDGKQRDETHERSHHDDDGGELQDELGRLLDAGHDLAHARLGMVERCGRRARTKHAERERDDDDADTPDKMHDAAPYGKRQRHVIDIDAKRHPRRSKSRNGFEERVKITIVVTRHPKRQGAKHGQDDPAEARDDQ